LPPSEWLTPLAPTGDRHAPTGAQTAPTGAQLAPAMTSSHGTARLHREKSGSEVGPAPHRPAPPAQHHLEPLVPRHVAPLKPRHLAPLEPLHGAIPVAYRKKDPMPKPLAFLPEPTPSTGHFDVSILSS
ncbi:hypothetical protein PFISCL1PPCAC_18123, partial [Pristionchus fissidentatus]